MIRYERRLDVRLISAEALKQYMAYRGLSLRQLGEKAGVSHSLIGHLRHGDRKTCKPENARKIAAALNCPVDALFVPKVITVVRNPRQGSAA